MTPDSRPEREALTIALGSHTTPARPEILDALATDMFRVPAYRQIASIAIRLRADGEHLSWETVRARLEPDARASLADLESGLSRIRDTLRAGDDDAVVADLIERRAWVRAGTLVRDAAAAVESGDAPALRRIAAELAEHGERATSSIDRLDAWGEDPLGTPPEPRPWLLRDQRTGLPFMPAGVSALLASAGGVGKTQAALQLALSIASGRPWLGTFDVREGSVLLVLAESDRAEVSERLHHASVSLGLDAAARARAAKRVHVAALAGRSSAVVEMDASGNVVPTAHLFDLRRYLAANADDWRLVVADPLSRLGPSQGENDAAAMTRTVTALESFCGLPGAPVALLLHHTSKAGRDGGKVSASAIRGSTSIHDAVRFAMTLRETTEPADHVELCCVKANLTRRGRPLLLARRAAGVLVPASVAAEAEAGW